MSVPDIVPVRTADGSFTLHDPRTGDHYHSTHGAVQEARHVFIRAGLHAVVAPVIDVLEVGLGTGLNALLTLEEVMAGGRPVRYHALDPLPLPEEVHTLLDHPSVVKGRVDTAMHCTMMGLPGGAPHEVVPGFSFQRDNIPVQRLQLNGAFDLVYFDAFAPNTQPEMWTPEVFGKVHAAMRHGAKLVTYCAKGDVRRALQDVGLHVERLHGPPGKREMLRATKVRSA